MRSGGEKVLMRIFVGESDRHGHRPLYEALVGLLRKEGLAGATVLRGVSGFGAHSVYHTTKLLRLSTDLPMVVEVVDSLFYRGKGAYLVANLVAYYAMKERAKEFGMSSEMLAKNDMVIDGGLKSLEICKRAGIKVGYGSDLLGALQVDQSREFLLRREVLSPIEIIRQATLVGAEIVRMPGKLGVVAPGAFADILVVDGDPIKKLELLTGQGENLSVIMKAGRFHKNRLAA